MTTDNEERKHRRISNNDSEEPFKRHKHRHHRHHSRKNDKDGDTPNQHDEEITDMPPPLVPVTVTVNRLSDYDMEEGEIVEDDGADVANKVTDSDTESGEIQTGTLSGMVEPNHSLGLPLDDESNGSKSKERNDNGHMRSESKKGSGNRRSHYDDDDEYETRECSWL